VVAATTVVGTGLLGAGLSAKPGSPAFYASTGAVAVVWTFGGFASGPLHRGRTSDGLRRPLLTPVAVGAGAFGLFYAAALVAKRIPVLDDALVGVLSYAEEGDAGLVLATTLANGVAEEVFFRGALFEAVPPRHAVAASTAVNMAATAATRNPALVLAAGVMGTLFGWQRRRSGGIQAPALTHVTWSALMLRFLPPLFRGRQEAVSAGPPGAAPRRRLRRPG
jgi:membrane protease YdiL (CAAX protease family)